MEADKYPPAWRDVGHDFDPNANMMQFERFDKRSQKKVFSDYMTVQNRLLWFIKDQRALIMAGVATVPHVVNTELVEIDRDTGWAHFKTTVRDVLGNEATMYGSESVKDFPDYAEKASTKSLGRALLALGYGTNFAPEMDEGERVVDAPVSRQSQHQSQQQSSTNVTQIRPKAQQPAQRPQPVSTTERSPIAAVEQQEPDTDSSEPADDMSRPATGAQIFGIGKLHERLGLGTPKDKWTYGEAREYLLDLNAKAKASRSQPVGATPAREPAPEPPSVIADPETQQKIANDMRAMGKRTVAEVQDWLDGQVGRFDVDAKKLRDGESNLTALEAQTLLKVIAKAEESNKASQANETPDLSTLAWPQHGA